MAHFGDMLSFQCYFLCISFSVFVDFCPKVRGNPLLRTEPVLPGLNHAKIFRVSF